MQFWHMRLFPGKYAQALKDKEEFTRQALDERVIGLDWGCENLDPDVSKIYEKLKNKLLCEFSEEEKELFFQMVDNENCGFPGKQKETVNRIIFEYFCQKMKEGDIVLITGRCHKVA